MNWRSAIRRFKLSLLVFASCLPTVTSHSAVSETVSSRTYQNPVLNLDFPDPMIFHAQDGFYYAYATGAFNGARGHNISVSRSKDLVHWEMSREALPIKPSWARKKHNFWAPHVVEFKNRYYMFYAAEPDWSAHEHMRLAVATSFYPTGPFIDAGTPIDTGESTENVDPMVFEDTPSGKFFLYWGRDGVITVQELSADLTHFAAGSHPKALIQPVQKPYETIVEAPFVIFKDGSYFLFYSGDDCCELPHYAVMVARASHPTGPFERLSDLPRRTNGAILQGNSKWLAPGHNAVITDEGGQYWIIYHAVDSKNPRSRTTKNIRRVLMIDRLDFNKDSWPEVKGPTTEPQPAPQMQAPQTPASQTPGALK